MLANGVAWNLQYISLLNLAINIFGHLPFPDINAFLLEYSRKIFQRTNKYGINFCEVHFIVFLPIIVWLYPREYSANDDSNVWR